MTPLSLALSVGRSWSATPGAPSESSDTRAASSEPSGRGAGAQALARQRNFPVHDGVWSGESPPAWSGLPRGASA